MSKSVSRDSAINGVNDAARAKTQPDHGSDGTDLTFVPTNLARQCRRLVESYHEIHGYSSLPDMLWKFRLGTLIESHRDLRQLLRKASTTRSAKKTKEGFVQIATTILSLEVLASSFAGWSMIFPAEAEVAREILRRSAHESRMLLLDFYLYPPKQVSAAAAALALPAAAPPEMSGSVRI